MRILLTNDDGINAAGIYALAERLAKRHTVFVSAPDAERSGAAHAFTYITPMRAKRVTLPALPDVEAFAVNGTPVDCVKLAFGNLCSGIDFVISGINIGCNLGSDVRYSGTVSAAMEAALLGYKAFAVSIDEFNAPKHLDVAAYVTEMLLDMYSNGGLEFESVLNINLPDLPIERLAGIKLTGLSYQEYAREYIERLDPHDRPYYWLPAERITRHAADEDTDERWIRAGYVTVTPLSTDMTAYGDMEKLQGVDFRLRVEDDE